MNDPLPSELNRAPQAIHAWFEAQAEKSGASIAVVFEGERWTYADLNRRANQLGRHLRTLGIGPDVLVGIHIERSFDLIVAILAVLKAGGAYVPLAPEQPAERLKLISQNAGMRVLLTSSLFASGPAEDVITIDIGAIGSVLEGYEADNLECNVNGLNLTYLMYTSGSTGEPKGVCVTHSNVRRLFSAEQSRFRFNREDVWTMFHSSSFDFSVWELWGALLFGGTLVVPSYQQTRDPEAFYDLLASEGVTVLNQTPTAFRELLPVEQKRNLPLALRMVIFGGEALDAAMLRRWALSHPDLATINMYGITETTVHNTLYEIQLEDIESQVSTIGSALSDVQLHLLDEHLRRVPEGSAGELYVAGPGVARGYHRRQDLTAVRFVANAFGTCPGDRMYRTGDRARMLGNGQLEFLGRLDGQVKIRGHRIEVGEIEAVLLKNPGVLEAVVVKDEPSEGRELLVAYVVVDDSSYDEASLRLFARQRLPDYMAPAYYVALDALPRTVNGKLARAALPEPDRSRRERQEPAQQDLSEFQQSYVPPTTVVQEMLCEVWSRVLNVEPVGIEDDFFELGGHSLLATEVISQVRVTFGVEIDLRKIFDATTVAAFAEVLEEEYLSNEAKTPALLDSVENLSPEALDTITSSPQNS